MNLDGTRMSTDRKPNRRCRSCESTTDLYRSNCRHVTLCLACGKVAAEKAGKCSLCDAAVTRLRREYNVRAYNRNDKSYFIGRFESGLPSFCAEKKDGNSWSIVKEGLRGQNQVTDALRDKDAFTDILKRISKIDKTVGGSYLVLKKNERRQRST